MANNDYQLEELENAAVNKSNNAKRAAAAAALLAAGGAAGYAATNLDVNAEEQPAESLSTEDLDNVVTSGAEQVDQVEAAAEPVAQPVVETPQPVHQEIYYVNVPQQETEDAPDVSFDKTTHYYDEDGNLIATREDGTIDGHSFSTIDVDNDNRADILAYDSNDNGRYDDNEMIVLEGSDQIAMGNDTASHQDVVIADWDEPENEPENQEMVEPVDYYSEKDYADNDIHNDFDDEKTGETYSHDYAENNDNYNNNGDVDHYSADYAYEDKYEDIENKEAEDYQYDDTNDMADDDTYDADDEYLADTDTTDDTYDDFGPDEVDFA